MRVAEQLAGFVRNNDGKNYVYIAKEKANLDAVRDEVIESCDVANTKTKITLVYPIGIAKIAAPMDGVYVDTEASTEEFIRKWLIFNDGAFFKLVNAETLEVVE